MNINESIIISGKDSTDAKAYLEKQVKQALAKLKDIEQENKMKYTVVVQWSEEDNCFVVFLPEFEDVMQPCTHGDSYEEAIANAQEVIELLTETYREEGKLIPKQRQVQFV